MAGTMTGADLRAIRRSMGHTQAEFGKLLCVTAAFVGEMERGEKLVAPMTARMANFYLATNAMAKTVGDMVESVEGLTIQERQTDGSVVDVTGREKALLVDWHNDLRDVLDGKIEQVWQRGRVDKRPSDEQRDNCAD